eukprot:m51a1_g3170 hypothetical protein (436) ;mRNA; f:389209-390516
MPGALRGWNSYNCYGCGVTERDVLSAARSLCSLGLAARGWTLVVVDGDWADPGCHGGGCRRGPTAWRALCTDGSGRLVPAPSRFPRGFGPLAAELHAMGLLFGLHVMRGVPRVSVERGERVCGGLCSAARVADTSEAAQCRWNDDMHGLDWRGAAGECGAYVASLAALYASWGVDFVKADDMMHPMRRDDIAALRGALAGCGRPVRLSLSPGDSTRADPSPRDWEFLAAHCDCWRVSDDLEDSWELVKWEFALMDSWHGPGGRPAGGGVPDADMLPLGRMGPAPPVGSDRSCRLTPEQQRTFVTLCVVTGSPLFFGGHVPSLEGDALTLGLLCNDAVLGVHSRVRRSWQVSHDAGRFVWMAELDGSPGEVAVALFNIRDDMDRTEVGADLGRRLGSASSVQDLWGSAAQLSVWGDSHVQAVVPRHSCCLFIVPLA